MTRCFCGCGRKVGVFQLERKSANKVGREVNRANQELRRGGFPPANAVATIEDLLAAGEQHEQACSMVVHEEESFALVDWSEIRAWVRNADDMASTLHLTLGQNERIIDIA